MRIVFTLLMIAFLIGCEDVVEVDVPTDNPRLYIDAVFRIDTSKDTQDIEIKVGLTSGFFDELQPAKLDEITLTNLGATGDGSDATSIPLTESEAGVYTVVTNTEFFTIGTLELRILHEGQEFFAVADFVPTSELEGLEQGTETLFGDESTEIKVTFTDEASRSDFYLFDLDFDEFLVTEDEFYNGQRFEFSYFYDDNVKIGDELNISVLGVDEPFYNYMNQVIFQADGGGQGPFAPPAATVRGNIKNRANQENGAVSEDFPLGYFAICQTFSSSITVAEL